MAASNVSFGMLDPKYVNAAFIALAIHAGWVDLSDSLVIEISTAVLAADLSLGKDEFEMRWIKSHRKRLIKLSHCDSNEFSKSGIIFLLVRGKFENY
jgi:hypothetical protein